MIFLMRSPCGRKMSKLFHDICISRKSLNSSTGVLRLIYTGGHPPDHLRMSASVNEPLLNFSRSVSLASIPLHSRSTMQRKPKSKTYNLRKMRVQPALFLTRSLPLPFPVYSPGDGADAAAPASDLTQLFAVRQCVNIQKCVILCFVKVEGKEGEDHTSDEHLKKCPTEEVCICKQFCTETDSDAYMFCRDEIPNICAPAHVLVNTNIQVMNMIKNFYSQTDDNEVLAVFYIRPKSMLHNFGAIFCPISDACVRGWKGRGR